eukprot:g551.t1
MSAGVTLDAVFYGEKLRDAQRHFYETLEGGSGGTSSTKSGRLAGTLSRVSGEVQPEQAIPGSVPNVESVSPRTSLQARAASAKRQGYGADGEISPKERHRYGPERFFYERRSYTGVHPQDTVQQIVRDANHGTSPASYTSPTSARSRATSFVSFRSRASSTSSARRQTVGEGGDRSPRYGPERFFYDQHTYTGAHRSGGPSVSDGPRELSQILRRESSEVSPLSARTPRGSVASLSGAMSRLASRASVLSTKTETEEEPPRSARASASRASYASIASTQMSEASPRSARSSKANLESFRYGPERFFYDSRSPTNVDVRDVETPRSESQVSPRKSVGSATARSRAWSTMSSRSNMLDDA